MQVNDTKTVIVSRSEVLAALKAHFGSVLLVQAMPRDVNMVFDGNALSLTWVRKGEPFSVGEAAIAG